ncbi:hypothetical protein A2375_02045 [Candidatus Woesebacteria bacterium RIFOXYB1_FULL_31_120]|nr:MAG: hypothetical protein A2375_02045 [Candidatus Woesebacteria bacterium RIFOXYB1_FULL_31_120]
MINLTKFIGKRPTGTMGEFATMLLLPESRLIRKSSHDIKLGKTKIEVKSSRARKNGGYIFNLQTQQKRWSPVFALVCFQRGDSFKIERFYLINKEKLLGMKSVWIMGDEFQDFRVY